MDVLPAETWVSLWGMTMVARLGNQWALIEAVAMVQMTVGPTVALMVVSLGLILVGMLVDRLAQSLVMM